MAKNKKETVEETLSDLLSFVFFVDGSSQPNPGYGGYGYFGYSLKEAKRPKSINYPVKNGYQFTRSGIVLRGDNEDRPYEVVDIYEKIYSFNSDYVTNNIAELEGVISVIDEVINTHPEDTKEIIIYTDSAYVVRGSNDFMRNWIKNNWVNSKGAPVANVECWKKLQEKKMKLEELGITLSLNWVKGHDDSIGNNIVDMYAVIGTNVAREQYLDGYHHDSDDLFNFIPYKKTTPVSQFRKEIDYRPYIYNYKAMFFPVRYEEDSHIALVVSPESETTLGTRSYNEAYAIISGDIPKEIVHIKDEFRQEKHSYNSLAILHLSRVKEDKILMRIIEAVGFSPLISKRTPTVHGEKSYFMDGLPFIEYCSNKYPFKVELNQTFEAIIRTLEDSPELIELGSMIDITDLFKTDGKASLTFQDKSFDLGERLVVPEHDLVTKPIIFIGSDTPPYAVFKEIGDRIESVHVYPETDACGNLATLVFVITYKGDDGQLCTVAQTNFLGKFLIRRIQDRIIPPKEVVDALHEAKKEEVDVGIVLELEDEDDADMDDGEEE